jgi:hypothetical protein
MEGLFRAFLLPALAFLVASVVGLVVVGRNIGAWWPLLFYATYLVLFFCMLEIWVLCRHCPFYAREGRTLRCPVNYGLPRIWRYLPKPLGRAERFLVLLCFFLIGAYPPALMAWVLFTTHYGSWALAGLLAVAMLNLGTMSAILVLRYCPRCVNFSCPLNRTPKEFVSEYLSRNPILQEAWGHRGK